jgi:1-deoxy-D-xylulose-5-phosphate synthase
VINMRFIKPLDLDLLRQLAAQGVALVTLEEHAVMAGAGSAVNEALHAMNQHVPVRNLGLPDVFLEHGPHADLLADCGLDVAGIVASVHDFMQHLPNQTV